MPPAERFLAPFLVLMLHGLLITDVVLHRPELLDLSRTTTVVDWLLAAFALFAYLRTVISDPGFLRPADVRSSKQQGFHAACFCCLLWCRGRRGRQLSENRSVCTGDGLTAQDVKKAKDSQELWKLQPIGRNVLDTVDEACSDPGEEIIDVEELEKGECRRTFDDAFELKSKRTQSLRTEHSVTITPQTSTSAGRESCDFDLDTRFASGGRRPAVAFQAGQQLRWCKFCGMHQPLRTKHCRECSKCVRTHDHHCPWIGTCVGEGNRVFFYWFLVAQVAELLGFFIEGCRALFYVPIGLGAKLRAGGTFPLLVIGLCVIALLLLMVACLLCFHTYLAMINLTTWENVSWHHISYLRGLRPNGSPFSISLPSNLATYCCMPVSQDIKHTEDGWAAWELGDLHSPCVVSCCCSCFGDEDSQ